MPFPSCSYAKIHPTVGFPSIGTAKHITRPKRARAVTPPHLFQQNIGCLEVTVDEVVAVQVGQPAGSIMGDAQASLPRQGRGVGVGTWKEGEGGEEEGHRRKLVTLEWFTTAVIMTYDDVYVGVLELGPDREKTGCGGGERAQG